MSENQLENIIISDYRMAIHMNCGKEHLSKHIGTFKCEGLPLHLKEFCCESSVRVIDFMAGKYGKSKSLYYLNESNSPMFDTLKALVEHYHKQPK